MKGLKISSVLLAVVLTINIYMYIYVQSTVKKVLDITYEAIYSYSYGDTSLLEDRIDEIVSITQKLNPYWQIVINHSETDEINVCVKHLKGAYEYDADMCIVYLNELIYHVENIYQRERLTVDNIF